MNKKLTRIRSGELSTPATVARFLILQGFAMASGWPEDDDYLASGYGRRGVSSKRGEIVLDLRISHGPHSVDPEDDQEHQGGIFGSPDEAFAYADQTPGRWMIMPYCASAESA
jgi:hypothetical protein